MGTIRFELAPDDWDEMEFRAFADHHGECDYIEYYNEDDDCWVDIDDYHFGLHDDIQKEVWAYYWEYMRGYA